MPCFCWFDSYSSTVMAIRAKRKHRKLVLNKKLASSNNKSGGNSRGSPRAGNKRNCFWFFCVYAA